MQNAFPLVPVYFPPMHVEQESFALDDAVCFPGGHAPHAAAPADEK
jgi:hypothetical protein